MGGGGGLAGRPGEWAGGMQGGGGLGPFLELPLVQCLESDWWAVKIRGACLRCLSIGEKHLWEMRMGLMSLRAQALLQPLGVPPTPAPAMLHTKSFPKAQSLEGAHHHK